MARSIAKYTASDYVDHLVEIKSLRELIEANKPVPPCAKHPRYKRIRPPRIRCGACWDYWNDRGAHAQTTDL